MRNWHGCTALITGASSGIGSELARQLAPEAAVLILAARRVERLEQFARKFARPGLEIHTWPVDLSDPTSVADFLQRLETSGLAVDLLINNAGLGDHGAFIDSDWNRVQPMLEVNIAALTRLTHALLPPMKVRGRGAIVNISSAASLLPVPKLAVYAATKAYVTSFSEAIRAELRGTGVTVTAVCPGPVSTEFGAVADRAGSTENFDSPEAFKVSVEEVARTALRAAARDRARVIPGWQVALVMTLVAALPMFVIRAAIAQRR